MPLLVNGPEDTGIGIHYHTFDESEYIILRSVLTSPIVDTAREYASKKDGKFSEQRFNYSLFSQMILDYHILLGDSTEWKLINETSLDELPYAFLKWLEVQVNACDGAQATAATVTIRGKEIPFRQAVGVLG